ATARFWPPDVHAPTAAAAASVVAAEISTASLALSGGAASSCPRAEGATSSAARTAASRRTQHLHKGKVGRHVARDEGVGLPVRRELLRARESHVRLKRRGHPGSPI